MFTVRNHQVAAHTGISVKLLEKENRERGMAPSEYRPDRGRTTGNRWSVKCYWCRRITMNAFLKGISILVV